VASFGSPLLFEQPRGRDGGAEMKLTHTVEFEDGSAAATGKPHDGMAMNYSWEEDEKLNVESIDGQVMLSGNPSGLVRLGEFLIQMGRSAYKPGFHIHLRKDFNADLPEILIVSVSK
jgi:hypothetical protein